MVRKIVLSFIAAMGIFALANAQQRQVSGTVTGHDGSPVAGATILVDGTTVGTTTGADGSFAITAPVNGTLTVSFVGYQTVKVPIAGKTRLDVTLQEDTQVIDDVTIVAYGAKRKQDLVGSVSKVSSAILENSQASSVTKALEGAVAGLQVISSSGQPGQDSEIYVRGIGSLSASNAALIVVDGVPFNGSLSDINPADIETMSVSKDAVSNSLYGSRAANGVILVQTKKGRQDRTNVSFRGMWGVNTRAYKDYDMADTSKEFYELTWYGIRNTQYAAGMSLADASLYASQNLLKELAYNAYKLPAGQFLVGTDGKLNPNAKLRYDDSFYDALFNTSFRQEYQASASGGTQKTDYYISMGYLDEDSYVIGSDYERITARVNVNSQLYKWLKVGTNIGYTKSTSNGLNESSGTASNAFEVARGWAPIYPVHAYDADGNVKRDENGNPIYDDGIAGTTDGAGTRPTATNQNVVCNLYEDIRRTVSHNISTRSYVEVKFLKDFTFTANYAFDYRGWNGTTYYTPTIGDGQSFGGRSTKSSQLETTSTFNQILAYHKTIGKHDISAKAGHEYYNYNYEYLSGQKTNFFDPSNPELDNGGAIQSLGSNTQNHNIEGYFVMADYDYDHKYYVSAAFRRDGTSRFKNRWGNFWSVGAAWRISAEEFMSGTNSWLNDLKIRASYGTQGNENIPLSLNGAYSGRIWTLYQDLYSVTWDGSQLGTTRAFYGNPDLTWEKQKTFDVGLDFRLWDRVTGTVDYFIRRTDDMLFKRTLAISTGRPYNWENLGAMRNSGIEFEIGVDIIRKRDFNWKVSITGAHYANEILTLPEENRADGITSGYFKLYEGKSRYEYYMYRYAGITADGRPSWYKNEKDENGKYIVTTDYTELNTNDKFWLGKSSLPDFTGGLNTQFYYKGFDLSIATAFQIGGYAYDSQYTGTLSSSYYVGHHRDMWKTWNPETGKGELPIWDAHTTSSYTQSSDAHLISASYFSLRNVTIGYTFPAKWMSKLGIQSIRVFVSGDNVALVSARQGFDPRVAMSGQNDDYGGYSPIRTISGGININF